MKTSKVEKDILLRLLFYWLITNITILSKLYIHKDEYRKFEYQLCIGRHSKMSQFLLKHIKIIN